MGSCIWLESRGGGLFPPPMHDRLVNVNACRCTYFGSIMRGALGKASTAAGSRSSSASSTRGLGMLLMGPMVAGRSCVVVMPMRCGSSSSGGRRQEAIAFAFLMLVCGDG